MNIRRGAVVLNQTEDGAIAVAYAGSDAGKAEAIYRAANSPGVWALHVSRQAERTKRFAAPEKPVEEQPAKPARRR